MFSRTTAFSATAACTASSTISWSISTSLVVCSTTPGSGIADMALAGKFLKRVSDGGPCPIGAVAVDPQLGGQFVGGLEADAPDVVGQLVGVLLDLGDGLLAVGAVDSHGPARTDAMLGQEEHDLADFLLLLPALADPLDPFLADPLDVQQEVGGRLEDFQRPFLVDADDLGGQLRPDAADRPGGQILFDAFRRGRVGGLEFVGLELLAVFPIHDPLAGRFQMLARRNRGGAADDRHQVLTALDLDLENGKTVLGVVVGDTFDQSGEGFGHGVHGTPESFLRAGSGSSGRTPYFFCLARPQGQPPNVTTLSMRWRNLAMRLPFLALVQTGQRFSQ